MKLYINVKQAGARKNYITKEEIILSSKPSTLRELIGAIVTINVKDFNEKVKRQKVIDYITNEEIDDKLLTGRVSFGEIYNTTGALIFRSVGYNKPWDGTWNGKPVPAGTYYYVIDPKNGRSKIAGYVTVFK